ncbi:MAG: transporter [Woeseiaceae bacterium]|nr:transporter [Woeseiaceae bacterium]
MTARHTAFSFRHAVAAALLATSSPVLANTGTVFSPDVKAGEMALEFRSSLVPEDGSSPDVLSPRLHFQYGFSDAWRARIIGVQRSVDGGSFDYRYTRVELQWQYREDDDGGHDAALRFEAQLGSGTPDRLRIGWTGKKDINDRWQLRANALVGRQFGDGAASGLSLETRFEATTRLSANSRLGLEMFNDLNTTEDLGGFDDQEHQLGPILKARFGDGWGFNTSYLVGVSDAADDGNWRLLISKNF